MSDEDFAKVRAQALSVVINDVLKDVFGQEMEFVLICLAENQQEKLDVTYAARLDKFAGAMPKTMRECADKIADKLIERATASTSHVVGGTHHKH